MLSAVRNRRDSPAGIQPVTPGCSRSRVQPGSSRVQPGSTASSRIVCSSPSHSRYFCTQSSNDAAHASVSSRSIRQQQFASVSRRAAPERTVSPAVGPLTISAVGAISASERSRSLRCVQVEVPLSSRGTNERSSPANLPSRRVALSAASGHSGHGSDAARSPRPGRSRRWQRDLRRV